MTFKTADKIRLENARKLLSEAGSASQLGDRLGMTKQQVSHIVGSRPIRGIGNGIARKLEIEFGRPSGWLDHEHDPLSDIICRLSDDRRSILLEMARVLLRGQ